MFGILLLLGRCGAMSGFGHLDAFRLFGLGQFLLQQRIVGGFEFPGGFIGLLGQLDLCVLGRATYFAQDFVVQCAGPHREFDALRLFFANNIVFVFLERALDRIGATGGAIVSSRRFNDAIRRARASVDQLLLQHYAAQRLNDAAFPLQIGAVNFNALAGF